VLSGFDILPFPAPPDFIPRVLTLFRALSSKEYTREIFLLHSFVVLSSSPPFLHYSKLALLIGPDTVMSMAILGLRFLFLGPLLPDVPLFPPFPEIMGEVPSLIVCLLT